MGIRRWARLCDIARDEEWRIRQTRSPRAREIREMILNTIPPSSHAGEDVLLWKHDNDIYKPHFSTKATWNQIRSSRVNISWAKLVWFSQGVPRYAFIEWLTFKNRLSTGDKMRLWGVNQHCVLCGEKNETRDHLFFACPYSFTVWIDVCGNLLGGPANPGWEETIVILLNRRFDRLSFILIRLALQVTIYTIWRERNGRIHQRKDSPVSVVVSKVDRTIRKRITSLNYWEHQRTHLLLKKWFDSGEYDRNMYNGERVHEQPEEGFA